MHQSNFFFFLFCYTCKQSLLQKGHAFFSTAANDAACAKQIGAGKAIQKGPVKKGASEGQVADMRILRTLAKYLWLKDNIEFRFRVLVALGLLVGAKVRSRVSLSFILQLECKLKTPYHIPLVYVSFHLS